MAKIPAKNTAASAKESEKTAKKTAIKPKETVKYKLPDNLKAKLKASLKTKTKEVDVETPVNKPEMIAPVASVSSASSTTSAEPEIYVETPFVLSEKAKARELAKAKLIEAVKAKYSEKAKGKLKETAKPQGTSKNKPIEQAVVEPVPEAKPIVKEAITPEPKTTPSPAVKAKTEEPAKAKKESLKEKHARITPEKHNEEDLPDVSLEAVTKEVTADDLLEITIEKKLMALYHLQQTDTKIDKIRIIRGELPLEVEDLEDEIAGLETRIDNYVLEIEQLEKQIKDKEASIKDSQSLIKKYEDQQMNVRNNREYDSITKEIEFQTLEIQLAEKRIKEFAFSLNAKNEEVASAQKILEERGNDLSIKKSELDDITTETKKEEENLEKKSEENQKLIEARLLTAYKRIRQNMRNGLAVVTVERDACGGCFNKIPPQRQLDIRMHRKIIVCEYCGRILVDSQIVDSVS